MPRIYQILISKYHFYFHLLFITTLFCQSSSFDFKKISKPFIKNYSNKIYKGSASNWSVIQDTRGVMYFGNEKGILEYDGNNWRLIKVPNTNGARTLAVNNKGTIYASAYADFGYLESNSNGQLQFKSLLNYLDEKDKNFGEMWDVAVSAKGVFFKSKDKVFRIVENKVTVWDSIYAFRLYNVNDTIYSRNADVGLMMIDGDKIKLMPDGDFFKDIGVYDMLPFNNGSKKILVTTNGEGLFLHDGKKFSQFITNADEYLTKNQIYNACETANGNYAFATQRGGVVIVDKQGNLLKIINEDSGLSSDVIYDVFSLKQGGLWLATANGISFCEEPSPFSIINNNGKLRDKSNDVVRFNNNLYVGNELGVLYLSKENSLFQLTEGSNKPAYSLLDVGNVLVAATNWGTTTVNGNILNPELNDKLANSIFNSDVYENRIYAAEYGGFTVFQKSNKDLKVIFEKDIDTDYFDIAEEKDGSLWLASYSHKLTYVSGDLNEFSKGSDKNIKYETYDVLKNLSAYLSSIIYLQNKLLIFTDKGIFNFNKSTKEFSPDSTLGSELSNPKNRINIIKKSINNSYWILAEINEKLQMGKVLLGNDGKYEWKPNPELQRLDLSLVSNFYPDYYSENAKELLWLNSDEGLIIYDPTINKNYNEPFSTLIRKVTASSDTVIYYGAQTVTNNNGEIILPYSKNDVVFDYSSTSYDNSNETLYQYFLEGNDENWSQWLRTTKKEYTNLAQGEYNFKVRSKNIYGIIGNEDQFIFKVLPPWYLTWWAYLLYLLIISLGIFIVDRIQRKRLVKKERDRAKIREAELIKTQAEELETVDMLVRVINKADNLDNLFNSLLNQTIKFIPQAEKAVIFLLDHHDNQYRVAHSLGYTKSELKTVTFTSEELKLRYTENSNEIEKGIYILKNKKNLFEHNIQNDFKNVKSILVMEVEKENIIEAYVVFDSFAETESFDLSTARILNKFREHAVSAISKAQSLKILQEKNNEILKTHEQLIIQEKLASLGTLTAGIAHEIKNPLNFVNNFAEVSIELIEELKDKLEENKDLLKEDTTGEIKDILENLNEVISKINSHGTRADSIVKSMLLHSRGNSGERSLVDINELLDQYLNLVYHGFRAKDKGFNITIEKNYDESIGKLNIIPQDISRVFLNILNNACYAANAHKQKVGDKFEPIIIVETVNLSDQVKIIIKDNGSGIPENIKKNLFNPFFTTKPAGEGTGLGLSLSYDIVVKEHGGQLYFNSEENKFTEFIIILPKKEN